MYQFKEEKCIFDGYDLSEKGWYIIGKPDEDLSFNTGIESVIETVEGIEYENVKSVKYGLPTISITFCKYDNNYIPLEITKNNRDSLNRILYRKTPKSLIIENKEYVGVFEGEGQAWRNDKGQGYITYNFRMSCPYVLSNKQLHDRVVYDNDESYIYNRTDIRDEVIYPNITITPLEDTTSITITNESNFSKIELNDLTPNNEYFINCFTEQIINNNNPKENVFNKISDDTNFITLDYGKNYIKIISKKAKVSIVHQSRHFIDEK